MVENAPTLAPTERLRGETLLLDGAMGTELERRGIDTRLPLWSARALMTSPATVRQIHRDYLAAGADIITTNTFRTTARTLGRAGYPATSAAELTALAVTLAREARDATGSANALIAGSIAPLEDCYSPWLMPDPGIARAEHAAQARQLAAAGVDLILVETMPTITEAVAAATAAAATGMPLVVGFTCRPNAGGGVEILDGSSLAAAVTALQALPVVALLVNCAAPPVIQAGVVALRAATDRTIGAYANLGEAEPVIGWTSASHVAGDTYAQAALGWLAAGATIVGGCCGTTIEHIVAIRRLLDSRRSERPVTKRCEGPA